MQVEMHVEVQVEDRSRTLKISVTSNTKPHWPFCSLKSKQHISYPTGQWTDPETMKGQPSSRSLAAGMTGPETLKGQPSSHSHTSLYQKSQ